jgi:rare lipoprotein A
MIARWAAVVCLFAASVLLSGCGHKKTTRVSVPPAPEQDGMVKSAKKPATVTARESPDLTIPPNAKPIYVETGVASWYGKPYHNRRCANGEVYDMYGLSAAHRTLPLNCVARVTNLKTGQSTTLRITDRGPFIENRILDLSYGAAKQLDVWRAGLAKVKIEEFESPKPIDHGGRWCIQIGAFTDKERARKLKEQLQRRYQTAQVQQFGSVTGDWIRIRVKDDDRDRAQAVLNETDIPEGAGFMVRLD